MPICPSCGQENPDGFRFCGNCGAELIEPKPAREGRKTVTIVFSDLADSTALGERLDPEATRRLMRRYYDAMAAAVERHGGTVEKYIGDAVMAVFGIPTLHEDDALRAVRAAADMREALYGLNDELERDYGVRMQPRTGVNTGEVVRRRRTDACPRRPRQRGRAARAGCRAGRDPRSATRRTRSCATPCAPKRPPPDPGERQERAGRGAPAARGRRRSRGRSRAGRTRR